MAEARLAAIDASADSLAADMASKVDRVTGAVQARCDALAQEARQMVQSLGGELKTGSAALIESVRGEVAAATSSHADLEAKRTALDEERARLDAEREQVAGLVSTQANKVKLQVGDHSFTTSRDTLCRVKGSMLEAMFSGRHAIKAEEDGSVFIDRDGEHFKFILNYLRDGKLPSGLSREVREVLAAEAEYYQLEDLCGSLRALDFDEVLGDEVRTMRDSEAHLRSQFYAGNAQALPPCAGLVSLFDEEAITFSKDPMGFPTLLAGWNAGDYREGDRVTVASLDEFVANYEDAQPGVLSVLRPIFDLKEPIFLAGGSVLQAALGVRWNKQKLSDIDLFVYPESANEAVRICSAIHAAFESDETIYIQEVKRADHVINIIPRLCHCCARLGQARDRR
jgi:hypothetical protein